MERECLREDENERVVQLMDVWKDGDAVLELAEGKEKGLIRRLTSTSRSGWPKRAFFPSHLISPFSFPIIQTSGLHMHVCCQVLPGHDLRRKALVSLTIIDFPAWEHRQLKVVCSTAVTGSPWRASPREVERWRKRIDHREFVGLDVEDLMQLSSGNNMS